MSSVRLVLGLMLVALLASAMPGCLFVANSTTTYGPTGQFVSQSTLDQIQPGSTTRECVVATLGQPSETQSLADGAQVLHYDYSKCTDDRITILVLFHASNEVQTKERLHVQINKDGVVEKVWKGTQ